MQISYPETDADLHFTTVASINVSQLIPVAQGVSYDQLKEEGKA